MLNGSSITVSLASPQEVQEINAAYRCTQKKYHVKLSLGDEVSNLDDGKINEALINIAICLGNGNYSGYDNLIMHKHSNRSKALFMRADTADELIEALNILQKKDFTFNKPVVILKDEIKRHVTIQEQALA